VGRLSKKAEVRATKAIAPATPVSEEKSLLNGPQLPENAQNQDDIDALFDSL
jgi:chemotaxis regulatin CheY-phosphate phosphatase CheZ